MIAEIGSLISSSKTAYDIAKGLTSVYYICNNCNSNFIDHSKPLILKDDYPEDDGIPVT
jgi:hypothetical protein